MQPPRHRQGRDSLGSGCAGGDGQAGMEVFRSAYVATSPKDAELALCSGSSGTLGGPCKEAGPLIAGDLAEVDREGRRIDWSLAALLAVLLALGTICAILLATVGWPHAPTLLLRQAIKGAERRPLIFVKASGLLSVNITLPLEVTLRSHNMYPISIEALEVTGAWSPALPGAPRARPKAISGFLFQDQAVAPRLELMPFGTKSVSMTYWVEFGADPAKDDAFLALLTACSAVDEERRSVPVAYNLTAVVGYPGGLYKKPLAVPITYLMPCPMGPREIYHLMKAAKVNLGGERVAALSANLRKVLGGGANYYE